MISRYSNYSKFLIRNTESNCTLIACKEKNYWDSIFDYPSIKKTKTSKEIFGKTMKGHQLLLDLLKVQWFSFNSNRCACKLFITCNKNHISLDFVIRKFSNFGSYSESYQFQILGSLGINSDSSFFNLDCDQVITILLRQDCWENQGEPSSLTQELTFLLELVRTRQHNIEIVLKIEMPHRSLQCHEFTIEDVPLFRSFNLKVSCDCKHSNLPDMWRKFFKIHPQDLE